MDAHKPNPDLSYAGVHYKHELPADDGRGLAPGMGASPASLSTASPDHMSVSNASTLQMPGQQGAGSGFHVSPQSTGTTGYGGYGGRGEAGPVSEMQA